MAEKQPGIKELYLASGSAAFPGDAAGVHGLGYDGKGSLAIGPFNEINGDKGIKIKTYENFKIEKKTNQFAAAFLKFLFGALKANDVSAKVVTSGVVRGEETYTSTGGIYTFDNTKSLGIDLEIEMSEKDMSIKVILEKAFKKATADAIKLAAKTDTLANVVPMPMIDADALPVGAVDPAFGSVTIAEDRLSTWKITIKFVGTKSGMNKSLGSRIRVEIEGTISGPDPDEIEDVTDFEIAPDITIAIPVKVPYNIVFKSGGLSKLGETVIDDDKREGTIKLAGEYELDYMDLTGAGIIFKSQLTA